MKLNVLKNSKQISSYSCNENDLVSDEIYIGRSLDCHVIIEDHKISRHQFVLKLENGKWFARNLVERSIAQLRGELLIGAVVHNGDVIELGEYRFQFSEMPVGLNEVVQKKNEDDKISNNNVADNLGHDGPLEMDGVIKQNDAANVENVEITTEEIREQVLENNIEGDSSNEGFSVDSGEELGSQENHDEATFEENSDENNTGAVGGFEEGAENVEDLSGSGAVEDGTAVIKSFAKFKLKLFGANIPYDSFNLEGNETFIGRDGAKCQIVLGDPEVSSVHAVIKKNMINCTLVDLNSGNGTILNGERINQSELKNGDEFIIGETTFTVVVESDLIDDESNRLMPVDENQEIIKEEVVEEEVDFEGLDLESDAAGVDETKSKSIFKDPKKRKILIFVAVGLGLLMLLDTPDPSTESSAEKEKSNKPSSLGTNTPSVSTSTASAQKTKKIFTPEQLDFLESNYQVAKSLFELGKYSETLIELDKVKAIDPDYKETAQIYSLAKQGLARIEEAEKLRKQEEERKLRDKKISDLVEKAKAAVKERQSSVADSLFSQILEMDPENIEVSQLKMEMDAYKKEQERIAQEKEKKENERKRQVTMLTPGKTFYLKNEWYKAIIKLEGFLSNKDLDEDLLKEASEMLSDAKTKLNDQISPLVGKARSFKEGQDLKGAYETYSEILKIDPTHEESLNEMTGIKESLDMRSKKIYREAIISESLSLFEDAKEKFQEVQQISPTDSVYYKKASEKLRGYFE